MDMRHGRCQATVRDHCALLTRQFLLKCDEADHPNHASTRDQPVGRIKQVRTDLRNEKPHICHLIQLIASGKTSEALAMLHTETVSNAIAAAKINVVLGGRPIHHTRFLQNRSEAHSRSLNRAILNTWTSTCLALTTKSDLTVRSATPNHISPLTSLGALLDRYT